MTDAAQIPAETEPSQAELDQPMSDEDADEALRLNDNGMDIVALGARFRKPYRTITAALQDAEYRRNDGNPWSFVGMGT